MTTSLEEQYKQKFKDKINSTARDFARSFSKLEQQQQQNKSSEREQAAEMMKQMIYVTNIDLLLKFANNNFEGEKPKLFISSSGINPVTQEVEDRTYLPYNEPKNHQVMLETLKGYNLISEDSTIDDYAFLFSFENKEVTKDNDFLPEKDDEA